MSCPSNISPGDMICLKARTIFGPGLDNITTIGTDDLIQVRSINEFGYVVIEVDGRLYPMKETSVRKISPLEALALQADNTRTITTDQSTTHVYCISG